MEGSPGQDDRWLSQVCCGVEGQHWSQARSKGLAQGGQARRGSLQKDRASEKNFGEHKSVCGSKGKLWTWVPQRAELTVRCAGSGLGRPQRHSGARRKWQAEALGAGLESVA